MYSGWMGPPKIISLWLVTDGEQSYDAVLFDMAIILSVVAIFILIAFKLIHRLRQEKG